MNNNSTDELIEKGHKTIDSLRETLKDFVEIVDRAKKVFTPLNNKTWKDEIRP